MSAAGTVVGHAVASVATYSSPGPSGWVNAHRIAGDGGVVVDAPRELCEGRRLAAPDVAAVAAELAAEAEAGRPAAAGGRR